ncbi:hypothetical protein DICPUDRAFT_95122 [Dictyostelium purpureum]|uniref:Peroxinectin n=1 Tax=Dictyostelium purpureum TaxID=5786 RepID=F0ZSF2_DICPU|nr:uncharacterized protein DICPUDRAFT_95122 [Dictyostelium purpureum]EGC33109.1 hypothetical protein DICPUDRAFT_95122 [Dictyostelium purpureum]|eukprot:XP_003290346.1 hypothetical protein DICPUDRAFT_95122 [Dictyostelium purpureum]
MRVPSSTLLSICIILTILSTFTNSQEFRSYTGENNNKEKPMQGSIYTPFIRLAKPSKFNANGHPNITNLPSRAVSNFIFDQQQRIGSKEHLTDFFNMFGQFLIHNMALSKPETNLWPIVVPKCDQYFDPSCTGNKTMNYFRTRLTQVQCDDGITETDEDGKCYEQINSLGAYIDANVLYGNSEEICKNLRSLSGGEMKNVPGVPMDNDANLFPIDQLYSVGERRGNENPGLLVIHTLFLREHNRLARKFAKAHSDWDDEKIFQHSRSCIIEQVQKITYEEYLPVILGSVPHYTGYNPKVNAQVSNEFTSTAFRFGHSEVGPSLEYYSENGTRLQPLPIKFSYFNPHALNQGIEPIVRGFYLNEEENIDIYMISDLRNFLFGKPGQGGLDLASRNLQRNRDHGIPSYNSLRKQIGLRPVSTWADISTDKVIQERLKKTYKSIDDIDAYVGGLAEDHMEGSCVGQTFYFIIQEQFFRTRAGDRFWYELPEIKLLNRECESTTFLK